MASDSAPSFESRVVVSDAGTTVFASGELDIATAVDLQKAITSATAECRGTLTLDMTGLTFCDSTGIRVLLTARRAASQRGMAIKLVAPDDGPVRQAFDMSGLMLVYARPDEPELHPRAPAL